MKHEFLPHNGVAIRLLGVNPLHCGPLPRIVRTLRPGKLMHYRSRFHSVPLTLFPAIRRVESFVWDLVRTGRRWSLAVLPTECERESAVVSKMYWAGPEISRLRPTAVANNEDDW